MIWFHLGHFDQCKQSKSKTEQQTGGKKQATLDFKKHTLEQSSDAQRKKKKKIIEVDSDIDLSDIEDAM